MYGTECLEEILQIGAVRVDKLGGPVTGIFNIFVKPRVHKRLSPGARVLPELQESLDSGVPFEQALRSFIDFCDGETSFAEWGRDDFKILGRNAVYFGLDPIMPESYIDVQAAFMKTIGADNATQLYLAAEYCGIPDIFVFHNALNDALYTSLVGGFASQKALDQCVRTLTPEDVRPVVKPAKPKKNQTRMGPFASRELTLNNMGCRRAVCGNCRKLGRVHEWYTADRSFYYGEYICPTHGRILRRLRLAEDRDGRFWAYNDTLAPSRENLARFEAARACETFVCRRTRSPSYLRHRSRRDKHARKRK